MALYQRPKALLQRGHIEIAEDFVGRMSAARRGALKRYIRGLDALALSQYMDLTAAMPAAAS